MAKRTTSRGQEPYIGVALRTHLNAEGAVIGYTMKIFRSDGPTITARGKSIEEAQANIRNIKNQQPATASPLQVSPNATFHLQAVGA